MINRVKNTVRRGTLGLINDTSPIQQAQIQLLEDEIVEDVERVQQYGFTSYPTSGDVIVLQVGAKANQMICICVNDDETRINISADDVAIYHKKGHHIVLGANGKITAKCTTFTIDAEHTEIMGTLTIQQKTTINALLDTQAFTMSGGGIAQISGAINITGTSIASDHISNGLSFNTHKHPDTTSGGNTGTPI